MHHILCSVLHRIKQENISNELLENETNIFGLYCLFYFYNVFGFCRFRGLRHTGEVITTLRFK